MSSYPNLSDGQPLRQTTVKTIHIPCNTYRFVSMKEQRYVAGVPVARFKGAYNSIQKVDYQGGGTSHSIQDFYDAMEGRFGEFTLTFNSSVYNGMYFDQGDALLFNEKSVNLYSTSVTLKQFPASGTGFPSITVVDPALPTLGNGTTGPQNQYPNQLIHQFSNVVVDIDEAARYLWARVSLPIPGGVLAFAAITDAEADIFENFFIQMAGMYGIFTLNYNGIAYANCRFNTEDFVRDYGISPNVNKITLPWTVVPD